jgi:predicted aspartyl protease
LRRDCVKFRTDRARAVKKTKEVFLATNKQESLYYAPVEVNAGRGRRRVLALIDSGASVTVIQEKVARAITWKKRKEVVRTANGLEREARGRLSFTVEVGWRSVRIEVVVAVDVVEEMLLGVDVLSNDGSNCELWDTTARC